MNTEYHEHAHTLVAAYALDATEPAEADAVEQHLSECPECRHDVREFRETAARLAAAAAEPTSDHLWPGIRSAIEQTPQLSATTGAGESGAADPGDTADRPGDPGDVVRLDRARRWPTRLLGAAAALLLVATVGLAVLLTSANRDLEALREHSDKVSSLLAATDLRRTTTEVDPGSMPAAVYVSRDMDTAMLTVAGLDPAPNGMGYQVWFVEPDHTMRSAGMLKSMDNDTMGIVCTGLGNTAQLGITMEPEHGSDHPSKPPMMVDV